jgi:hypothetical protein
MKKQASVTQRWIPYVLTLVLLLGGGLVSCKSAPPAPETVPGGPEIKVKAGETITIHADAKGADTYEWTLQGIGQISSPKGKAILYTAPNEAGTALLSVAAHNNQGNSPETLRTISVSTPSIPPGPIAIQPTQDTELEDKDCPNGARGALQAQRTISLSGLKPGQKYRLTLNGWKGDPLNDELCKIDCTDQGEGFWDFDMEVIADENGTVSQRRLEATLPSGVELYPDTTYKVKFFVKEGPPRYCTVLGHDQFRFTVESLQ